MRSIAHSKVCPSCGVEKLRSDYYKKGSGISYRCKPCTLADCRNRAPKYFGKYADYQNEWRRTKYQKEPEYRDKLSKQRAERYAKLKEELNQRRRERWMNDPHDPARLHFRRKDVKLRTPPWVDKRAILEIYANCPRDHHVDHVIPLKGLIDGRPVSGLHVPWNLQYLPAAENRKKYNRISEKDL